MDLNWARVVIDAIIVFVLSFIAGFIGGLLMAAVGGTNPVLIEVLNPIFIIGGFAYVSSRAPGNRWKHLFAVAIVTWLISLVQVLFGLSDIFSWLVSLIVILILMAIGGWLGSMLASRRS